MVTSPTIFKIPQFIDELGSESIKVLGQKRLRRESFSQGDVIDDLNETQLASFLQMMQVRPKLGHSNEPLPVILFGSVESYVKDCPMTQRY
jgi:hypothetical protein